jgi:quinol-cytochrome oxidoreductase complex cytochrome b subunit
MLITWFWGGFSVDNATLNHFFSPHYLLPFIIADVAIPHLATLHQYGSNNPLDINSSVDKIAFYPYFYVKDLISWVTFAIFFSIFIFYAPNVLGHLDNFPFQLGHDLMTRIRNCTSWAVYLMTHIQYCASLVRILGDHIGMQHSACSLSYW